MNILYISNKKKWGGITSWMQKTALDLEKRGHNVWIVSHKKSYFTRHASDEINIIPKNLGMDFNPITILWLVHLIYKLNIDLIVTNISKEVIIGGIAAKITRITHIRRIGNEKDYNHHLMKRFNNLIDYTIVPSDYVKNKVLNMHNFLKKDKIVKIHNGVTPNYPTLSDVAKLKRRYKIPLSSIIIGYTGKFSSVKNIPTLLDIFSDLRNDYDVHLILAGDGPQKNKIKRKIKELNIEQDVSLLGFVTNSEEIATMYDIGVLFSDIEGFSNSVVECMAVGTPVVCTDVGGQSEIVENNYNGFLIAPGKKEQLNDKLSILIDDKYKRKNFSQNCVQTIKNKFSEDIMLDKLEKIYKKYAC